MRTLAISTAVLALLAGQALTFWEEGHLLSKLNFPMEAINNFFSYSCQNCIQHPSKRSTERP